MKQRIILFGPLPPPYGGVSTYMRALAAHLREADIRVWHYAGRRENGARARFVAHRRFGTLTALLSEGNHARILDASHFHFEYPNVVLLTIWLAAKRLMRFEWYKNVHDGSLPKRYLDFGVVKKRTFQRALKRVDRFVVVSEELRDWLRDDLGVRQAIDVVPALLPPLPVGQARLPVESEDLIAPYLAGAKRVCSIGVFHPDYGFADVAAAVAELRERTRKDIRLLLLDGGFVCDEIYREEVLADREWITILEQVPNPQVIALLKQSDVFVRAFADESYGLSRIEALWAGTPVIATRAGETRGMLLYDFGDIDQLVAQLQAVLLYPSFEEPNPWAARFRREADENLEAIKKLLGIA